jgi:hypothetical protein
MFTQQNYQQQHNHHHYPTTITITSTITIATMIIAITPPPPPLRTPAVLYSVAVSIVEIYNEEVLSHTPSAIVTLHFVTL